MRRLAVISSLGLISSILASWPGNAAPSPGPAAPGGTTSALDSSPAQPRAAAQRGNTLVVKVRSPKKVGKASVLVTGPQGFRRTLRKSKQLRGLAPGRYRIKASAVSNRKWRATASASTKKVRLGTKQTRVRVRMDYDTIMSRRLSRLPTKAVKSYRAPHDAGDGMLKSSKRLSKGDIVAAGVSSKTPTGMLVKVVGTKGSGTYVVRQVTLGEAIPRGSFGAAFTTPLAAPAKRVRDGRAGNGVYRALPATCTSSGSAGIEMNASGGISVALDGDWDWGDSSLTMKARAAASASGHAWLTGAGSCTVAETRLFHRTFTPITAMVGPIPIVVLPRLEMFAGGKVSADGAIDVKGNVGVEATMSATASRKGFTTSRKGPTVTRSASFSSAANASANVYAKAVVTGELYGVSGPHASVRFGIQAKADKAANPWWTVDAVTNAGVGIKVNKCVTIFRKDVCLKFDKSKSDLFSSKVRIIDAGKPFSPGQSIVDDVAGSGVTITAPSTGGDAGTGRIPNPNGNGDAWVLSSGLIGQVPGTGAGTLASTDRGDPGNSALSAMSGNPTFDATFISMNVVPAGNRLQIDYLFATEEYPDFVGTQFNDVMGVFVAGSNCAHVPGTTTPVSVNTINDQVNSQYFVNNLDSHLPTVMNGLTTTLSCVVAVTPGVSVPVLIGVADAGDGVLDSAVALIDGGISSYNG